MVAEGLRRGGSAGEFAFGGVDWGLVELFEVCSGRLLDFAGVVVQAFLGWFESVDGCSEGLPFGGGVLSEASESKVVVVLVVEHWAVLPLVVLGDLDGGSSFVPIER